MLVNFSVSNYLSFNEEQTFSMEAGKTRKYSERIARNAGVRLTKCEAIFGANASGKSNFVDAFQFVQDMVIKGLPAGFSNKCFRQKKGNENKPSSFRIGLVLDKTYIEYFFSIILKTGSICSEGLYWLTAHGSKQVVFERDLNQKIFTTGDYFKKNSPGTEKLTMYGEDSISDSEMLFLNIINHGKNKLFQENTDLLIIQALYDWFKNQLTVSFPSSILTGYPYFSNSNLSEIVSLIQSLDIGISDMIIVDVPTEVIRNRIPDDIFNRIIKDLEKAKSKNSNESPSILLRSYKEFYTFTLDEDKIKITTIEFSHENKDARFRLKEESDGTARVLDLIELLLNVSDDQVFIIDEIDRCLHPSLTTKIIEYYLSIADRRNTQLIITTHESRLLASEFLRNDEICFIVKNKKGESIINPLDEHQLRADKKVYAALFDGTLENVLPVYDDKTVHRILSANR